MYRPDSTGEANLNSGGSAHHDKQPGSTRQIPHAFALKRFMDVAGAAFFLLLFTPLLVAVAAGVRLSSRGPILYAQRRVGKDGRSFNFYKFRSMAANSEQVLADFLDSNPIEKESWHRYQKIANDPRITRFGRFIRKTSLDELPQFWNVLKGDMSLVGPRPCLASQQYLYGSKWRRYCEMRPGLTGLWQVSGRNKLTYEQRVALDVEYLDSWSILLDIWILAKTVRVVITGHGSL